MSSLGDIGSVLGSHPPEFSRSSASVKSVHSMSSQNFEINHDGAQSRSSSLIGIVPSYRASSDEVDEGGSDQLKGLKPMLPSHLPRYSRNRKSKSHRPKCKVPAVFERRQTDSFKFDTLPQDWKRITHPEGQTYFCNDFKRVITESWIPYPDVFLRLERFINQVDEYIRFMNLEPLEDSYLVLDIVASEYELDTCYYYYAQASTRRVFWLTGYDISHGVKEIRGDLSESHLSK
ncbi:hypothetical protein H0H92_008965 [Tricholoma furcatifolium]|nr:hypothetical protein H0H92_008965 [Tricholoma furcatifolium]